MYLWDALQTHKQNNLKFAVVFVVCMAYWAGSDSNASFLIAVDFINCGVED